MSKTQNIFIACSYPITTDRIGGMDYFFWEIDFRLKEMSYNVFWLFRSTGSTQHYIDRTINFQVVQDSNRFQEELLEWLKAKNEVCLFVGHFLDYQSSIVKSIKKVVGNSVPCIYVDHMSRPIQNPSLSKRVKKKIKGILYYNQIDKIIAVSSYVQKSILSEIGSFWFNKTSVAYNGLKTENYKVEPSLFNKEDRLNLFCIGHLIKEKGFQTVVAACKILQEKGTLFHLTIAGDGNYKSYLVDLAHRNLSEESFTFLGNITNQSHWLNQSDIVIIPSIWNEAFGFTVVEALLMNKVVFATNVGGIPEILEDNDLMFNPNNEIELETLINNYLQDKSKYKAKAQFLHEKAKKEFAINRMVTEHINCYLSFLNHKNK